jgi:UTP:GlnB (protein PII) uridylyltransferase
MVRAVRDALVGAWRKIARRPSSRTRQRAARDERRYAGAKAAEEAERAERARQARAAERPNLHGNMGGDAFGG